jgi:hypothetical protein
MLLLLCLVLIGMLLLFVLIGMLPGGLLVAGTGMLLDLSSALWYGAEF